VSTSQISAEQLRTGDIKVVGRLSSASNVTLVGRLDADGTEIDVVYKPTSGTRPLWDFESELLARHEVAAYEVAGAAAQVCQAFGIGSNEGLDDDATTSLIPMTVLRPDGPFGEGSVQLWIDEPEDASELVAIVRPGELEPGWHIVFEAYDQFDRDVYVVHADDRRLRRMALLDEVLNNADRKGQHLLTDADNAVFGVDHGLCFHVDPKLRTVLWGWAGVEYDDADVAWLRVLDEAVHDVAAPALAALLPGEEIDALHQRLARTAGRGLFRDPPRGRSALPWPPV